MIKEPEEGHVRRDVPMNISAGLKPGLNTIKITVEDPAASSFAISMVRTHIQSAEQIATQTPNCTEEQGKDRVMKLLADTWGNSVDEEEEDEITCVISNKLKLRCPLSFERVVIPVRGEQCMHLQCFGLQAYLESNMKMRALNNRWTCPVCNTALRPQDLRIDGYVEKVLSETPSHIDEVLIMQDGSYRCIEENQEAPQARAKTKEPKQEARTQQPQQLDQSRGQVAPEAENVELDGGMVTEVTETINAVEEDRKRKEPVHPSLQRPLTKRQRQRMERKRALNADVVSENDSDPVAE